jgi:hypothetical protein
MKIKCAIICLLVSAYAIAQTKVITVLDAKDKTPLEGVKITFENGRTQSTDAYGKIKVNTNHTIELTYIGYASTTIAADTVTRPIELLPETYELNDVTIQATKRKKYTAKVLPKKGLRSLKMQNYGTGAPLHNDEEAAVYIPVDAVKNGAVVTGIFFQPTDYRTLENGKYLNHAGAKHAPFKANVYYADAKSHVPLTPVFEEDFEVKLEEGEKYAVIKLDESQKFTFPAEGICIVVRACAADYYHALGFKSAPAFDKLDVGKKNMFWQFRKALYQGDEAEWKTEFLFATRNEIYRFDVEVEYYE